MNTLSNFVERKAVRVGAVLLAGLSVASCSEGYSGMNKYETSFTGMGLGTEPPFQSCLKGNKYYDPNLNYVEVNGGGIYEVDPNTDAVKKLYLRDGSKENELVPADRETALTLRGLNCAVSWQNMFEDE